MRRSYSNAVTLILNAIDENDALEVLHESGFSAEQIENHARRLNQKLNRLRERLEKKTVNDVTASQEQEDFDVAMTE